MTTKIDIRQILGASAVAVGLGAAGLALAGAAAADTVRGVASEPPAPRAPAAGASLPRAAAATTVIYANFDNSWCAAAGKVCTGISNVFITSSVGTGLKAYKQNWAPVPVKTTGTTTIYGTLNSGGYSSGIPFNVSITNPKPNKSYMFSLGRSTPTRGPW